MDTYLSDADKEAESSCQSNEKREGSFSTNAIYSVPFKTKKVRFLNALVPLPCFNILMHVYISGTLYSLFALQTCIQYLFHMQIFVIHLLLHELDRFVGCHRVFLIIRTTLVLYIIIMYNLVL